VLSKYLPEPLCWIFPDLEEQRPERQELPREITDAMCTGRQVALWTMMGYKWKAILSKMGVAAVSNSAWNRWQGRLADRRAKWRGLNGILSGGVSSVDRMSNSMTACIRDSCYILQDDELFFRRLGACSYTADFYYTSPFDRDKDFKFAGPITVFKLPLPQDVPPGVRNIFAEEGRIIPEFQAWLERNPAIKQWTEQAALNKTSSTGWHPRPATNLSSRQLAQDFYTYLSPLGPEAQATRGRVACVGPNPHTRRTRGSTTGSSLGEQGHSDNRPRKRSRSELDDGEAMSKDRATQTPDDMATLTRMP
jgi:hypothetical protein